MDDAPPAMYTDDTALIAGLLKDNWSLGPGREPAIAYKPESYLVNSRYGNIYVYLTSRSSRISSTDYRTLQRNAHVGIRVSSRFRENHFDICEEVYRILLGARRAGKDVLYPYTFLEIPAEHHSNDMTGWYMTTIDVKLVSYNTPLHRGGFGERVDRCLECD